MLLCKVTSRYIVAAAGKKKESTANQLLEINYTIISNVYQEEDVRFNFCDISKAFDKVYYRYFYIS